MQALRIKGQDDLIRWSLSLFYFFEVFAGPLRYYAAKHGLVNIVYLPKIEMVLAMLWLAISGAVLSPVVFIALAIIILYFLLGLSNLPSSIQSSFALWSMVPLLFAIFSTNSMFGNLRSYRNILFILYAVVLSGVALNYFHNVPWSGSGYAVGGQHIQSSRAWASGGFVRIAGFGRASYSAASQALLLTIFLSQLVSRKIVVAALWAATGIVVIVTTSKGVILSFFLIVSFLVLRSGFNRLGRVFPTLFRPLAIIVFGGFWCTMIVLPLLTISNNVRLNVNSPVSELIFESFQERLSDTWPRAFQLLHTGPAYLLGNGLGGMGMAQYYFDQWNYNSGDNLFVFLIVQYGGIVALPILLILFYQFTRNVAAKNTDSAASIIVLLVTFLVVYGCLSNELEDGCLASAVGFCLAYKKPGHRLVIPQRIVAAE